MITNNNMYSPAQSQAVNAIGSPELASFDLERRYHCWLAGLHDPTRSSGPIAAVRRLCKRRYDVTVLPYYSRCGAYHGSAVRFILSTFRFRSKANRWSRYRITRFPSPLLDLICVLAVASSQLAYSRLASL